MKLNPPASSSDLDVARQIARRLHQHRRKDDPGAVAWPADEPPMHRPLTPPPLPPRAPASHEAPAPAPVFEAPRPLEPMPQRQQRPEPPPPRRAEAPPHRELPPEPAPPPSPRFQPAPEPEPEPSFAAPEAPAFERPGWSEPEEPEPEPEPEPFEALAPPPPPPALDIEVDEPPATQAALPDVDVDEPPLSPEEMVGEGEAESEASPLDSLTEPEGSSFADELLDAPAVAEEPATPSWDEIVESCLGLAQAGGAMLVDPAGQVFAARGDWPAPGPEAIATKLVSMMAKTLKDAPTRSISAPLMGMHLTAWRVPLGEGLVTAAFIGRAPVRADARPAIDAEIHRGAGA